MIPRLAPSWDTTDILCLFSRRKRAVAAFEKQFAKRFGQKYGLSFAYGRTGLYIFLKTMGWCQAEVIMPAYSCVVVAHAITLSGNIPVFVDSKLPDFNMDLALVKKAITAKTRCIIATHIFGYPLNLPRLKKIVKAAEKKYHHKIWIVQDCAHSFGAKWQGKLVTGEPDLTLFGLNISKTITCVQGGMITTNHQGLYRKMRNARQKFCYPLSLWQSLRRFVFFLTSLVAFRPAIYSLVNWLERKTILLNRLVKYYQEDMIDLPKDAFTLTPNWQAKIGLSQLKKYDAIVQERIEKANFYFENIKSSNSFKLPPQVDGATYSHFVCLVKNQRDWLEIGLKNQIQFGKLIDYVIPLLPAYKRHRFWQNDIAIRVVSQVLNLPINHQANVGQITHVINTKLAKQND